MIPPMDQDALKKLCAEAALAFVEDDMTVGVGTGSTVNHFIDALATRKARIAGDGFELRGEREAPARGRASP